MVEVIGEGSYGCVTKPSLRCKVKEDYHNKVSKIMAKEDAEHELDEIQEITKIPNIEKYILNKPAICTPIKDKSFYKTVKNCNNSKIQNAIQNNEQIRLLILDDGGVDLDKFMHDVIPSISQDDIDIFLTSILKLLEGIQFFRTNHIIHRDIKLLNIVYNLYSTEIKFIDFGLVTYTNEFMKDSNENHNYFAQSWYYYPKENSCVNKDKFIFLDKCSPYRTQKYNYFIHKVANTFDSYCLTFCLIDLFQYISKKIKHIPSSFFRKCMLLFREYCEENIYKRNSNIKQLYSRYKTLLKQYNVYKIHTMKRTKSRTRKSHRSTSRNAKTKLKTKTYKHR
jgi:serine/threonine protein kinase